MNAVGKKQAELLSDYFKKQEKKFDLVYTSNLNRAVDTCLAIVGKENCKKVKINKLLIERGFGRFAERVCLSNFDHRTLMNFRTS